MCLQAPVYTPTRAAPVPLLSVRQQAGPRGPRSPVLPSEPTAVPCFSRRSN